MEIIQKELRRSRLYSELSWKRFERQASIPLLIGLFILTAYLSNMIYAIAELASNQVYFLF